MVTISSNLNVSDIVRIFKKIEDDYGDLEVVGECEDCTTGNMSVFILTDDKNTEKCWIQVSSPEK